MPVRPMPLLVPTLLPLPRRAAACPSSPSPLQSHSHPLPSRTPQLFAACRYELVGINSVVYVEAKDPEGPSPTVLVQRLCKQAAEKQARTGGAGREGGCQGDGRGTVMLQASAGSSRLPSRAATAWGTLEGPTAAAPARAAAALTASAPLPLPPPASRQVNRTKWCNRFYPVEHSCYASMDKIEELAAAVVAQHFPPDAAEGIEVRRWRWVQCCLQQSHRGGAAPFSVRGRGRGAGVSGSNAASSS